MLDGSTLVNHLFVLSFLCRKCYGMVDKREFCFVLLCVVNINCSINVVAKWQKTKAVLKSKAELYGVYDTVEMYQKQIKM